MIRTSVAHAIAKFISGGVGQEIPALMNEVGRRWPDATEQEIDAALTAADAASRDIGLAMKQQAAALRDYRRGGAN